MFPVIISGMGEASDFNIGMRLGFAKAHHKIPHRRKSGRGSGLEELAKIWGFPLIFVQRIKLAISNLACGWCLPRPTIKPHPEEKWAWPLARKAPRYLAFLSRVVHIALAWLFVFLLLCLVVRCMGQVPELNK